MFSLCVGMTSNQRNLLLANVS